MFQHTLHEPKNATCGLCIADDDIIM